jgi:zeaxanthin glucosyltransferase
MSGPVEPLTRGIRQNFFVIHPEASSSDNACAAGSIVAFAMLSETGHYHGSFRLARVLRERGHEVWYIGIADFADLVREQGFRFIPVAGDLLPKGYLDRWAGRQAKPARLFPSRQSAEDRLIFRRFVELIDNGGLDDALLNPRPDVLVCDTLTWYFALRAWKLRIPTVQLNITLSFHPGPHVPPVVFTMQPENTRRSRAATLLAWKYLAVKFFFTKRLASMLFGAYRYPHRMHHLSAEFRRIARHAGYPLEKGITYHMSETGPMLALEEIVISPKAFNFPDAPNTPGRTHLGSFIDLNRSEQPLPEAALDSDKPLIVCSLGTNAFYYPHAPRFFECVYQASRLEPAWQFVLHLADPAMFDRLGEPPENLLVQPSIPQLTLLRRAAVMVGHGGINSIIECVHFGVPMVILPGLRDQPGAAARASYHDLALVESMAKITSHKLVSRIRQAMHDRRIGDGIARMRRRMQEEDGMTEAIARIEARARPASRWVPGMEPGNRESN